MKTKLTDLNDHLFAQLERLGKDLEPDELEKEITRSKAMCGISAQIISNADLALRAHTSLNTGMNRPAPKMLGVSDE